MTMNLIELLTRACDGLAHAAFRQATLIVLRKWPTVRRFTDEQLSELRTELTA